MITARSAAESDGCARTPHEAFDYELGCICGEGKPCECNDSDPPDTSHVTAVVEPTLQ
jgi:hypothetical protein